MILCSRHAQRALFALTRDFVCLFVNLLVVVFLITKIKLFIRLLI